MTGTDVATYTRERPGMSAFVLEDILYHTYSTYAQGLDGLTGHVLARPRPKARNRTRVWWRRHDEYAQRKPIRGCG